MTGKIDDAFDLTKSADPSRADQAFQEITEAAALLEQAKGVLIFRYSIDAWTAFRLIEGWATEAGVGMETVAHALVHEICQGDQTEPSEPRFVRWLEGRLRHEFPSQP